MTHGLRPVKPGLRACKFQACPGSKISLSLSYHPLPSLFLSIFFPGLCFGGKPFWERFQELGGNNLSWWELELFFAVSPAYKNESWSFRYGLKISSSCTNELTKLSSTLINRQWSSSLHFVSTVRGLARRLDPVRVLLLSTIFSSITSFWSHW